MGRGAVLCAAVPHFGEEPPISGTRGSGTLFFGGCNLRCVYCQNWQISQARHVRHKEPTPLHEIAGAMLDLQAHGCHNVSLVTASHVVPYAIEALLVARRRGLRLPVVYNTNSYDGLHTLELLDGLVDVYLADLRYAHEHEAWRLSRAERYVRHSRTALREMARQVGPRLVLDGHGIAQRGLIIRLLVLPNRLAGVQESLRFIAEELGVEATLAILAQYKPTYKALRHPLLARKIFFGEYFRTLEYAERLGFTDVWVQDLDAADFYNPDFSRPSRPFEDADHLGSCLSSRARVSVGTAPTTRPVASQSVTGSGNRDSVP